MKMIRIVLLTVCLFLFNYLPANASRITDSYDGNIFPIYAGNGSIVPPQTTLSDSLKSRRVSVLFFYLDDSSASKALAPVISGLDLIWRNNIDIIALTTDEIQGKENLNSREANYYWNGLIPQTIVINKEGEKVFDQNGLIDIDEVNNVISESTGIAFDDSSFSVESFSSFPLSLLSDFKFSSSFSRSDFFLLFVLVSSFSILIYMVSKCYISR